VGDFNLDGKPDLAVANSGHTTVTILLGDGSGGFTQPSGSPVVTGNQPFSVAVGDFNLDGRPDFATVNANSNNVTIELNTCGATPTPTPPTIQFSSSSYSVNETGPSVAISLTRSGDTTSAASVNFATNDGAGLTNCDVINHIASPRCDYENTIGTMTWAAGDATAKTFSIAIVDDGYAEGPETFTIGLNSPSGATLGTQSTATVTIQDNEGASNGVNPIDQTNFFVRQQYIDFLGREPDPGGFAGWTSSINNCSGDTTQCDRIHVSQLFFQSAEFQTRGYFVYRFYPVAFGRKPDYAEFVPDLASVSGFLSDPQLEAAKVAFIANFMARPAFVSAYSFPNTPTGNQQYVDALLNTAGVTLLPSPATRQALINGLNNATLTRAQVLRQIVESAEVSTKYNHQAYAVMEYFGYLRRQPDGGYLAWIAVLDGSNDPRGMVTGFVNSIEYRNRFGP
jgi:VCBS repeat protein/Calx-beta domain-containing protein